MAHTNWIQAQAAQPGDRIIQRNTCGGKVGELTITGTLEAATGQYRLPIDDPEAHPACRFYVVAGPTEEIEVTS